ncbi:DNA-binding transcriptional LysR family regulator [Sphingobium fontiphilum]|uniref:DNA-binding transcriptional LysR family regulator n=1 Tax=Sphingobium fontiphilum TaxID=944425 RepID=A0A7W6GQ90_9SPHN|nr:LysR substrate-binding domain-containing protein [Sphingobium fontiphilum]MBB3983645.1 DNA-binding transcriptional LysR family regulator [Sphingobium fontiphilum]
MVDIVAEGYDLAIRTGLLAEPRLTATRIASHPLHICAAPACLDHHGRPEKIADLAPHCAR